ncbi:MAG: 30S ribosomal protein S8 [Clostridia bacterium]|nr:30S ribosomal protein S8 [Clostridia bacterium]
MTDPIADMLTRIRNALTVKKEKVEIPASKLKIDIANILVKEGYIQACEVIEAKPQNSIVLTLKYAQNKNLKVITGLERVSKPGLRVYADVDNIPKVYNGLGIAILSTSKGILSDKEARAMNVGGEVLAKIW